MTCRTSDCEKPVWNNGFDCLDHTEKKLSDAYWYHETKVRPALTEYHRLSLAAGPEGDHWPCCKSRFAPGL